MYNLPDGVTPDMLPGAEPEEPEYDEPEYESEQDEDYGDGYYDDDDMEGGL